MFGEGETLSAFVEASIRAQVDRRVTQREFVARGLASLEEARRTGEYYPADEVIEGLRKQLEAAKRKAATGKSKGRTSAS